MRPLRPLERTPEALDAGGQLALTADLTTLLARFNRAGADSLVVPGEYLEVEITRA